MEEFAAWDVPEPVRDDAGVEDLTFDGQLTTPLRIEVDGGAAGCGGKLWPAGDLLSRYLIKHPPARGAKIIELGSGTGLAGMALALAHKASDFKIYVTDQTNMVPLMQRNVELNELGSIVEAAELDWGTELPSYAQNPDLILAADCVYLESAFPLLEKTLLYLTDEGAPVLMAYKKRRKADRLFFKAAQKNFSVVEITDYPEYDQFKLENVHLFKMTRK